MATDPNADLIDRTIEIDGKVWTVAWSATWSRQYVQLRRIDHLGAEMIVRPAAVVRRHLQLAG